MTDSKDDRPQGALDRRDAPATRAPQALRAVDRAAGELRRGRPVVLRGGGGRAVLIQATEQIDDAALEALAEAGGGTPELALTARRAASLGMPAPGSQVVVLSRSDGFTAEEVFDLADPIDGSGRHGPDIASRDAQPFDCWSAAVGLTKIARLLPAAVTVALGDDAGDLENWALRHDFVFLDAGDVFRYPSDEARTLKQVGEARVPLMEAHEARIHAFRPADGAAEHLAIVIGEPDPERPVLARVHSECFTGDLLGSLRCDCGQQLQGAIREIAAAGGGVLLYLAQEGRGIGLVNKLRAYELQDRGFDTIDANEQLGFDADERVYMPAARILRMLGFTRVRLMTNNPDKVTALEHCGIEVAERVPHAFPSNKHNEDYLRTKASRAGHLF